MIWREKRIPLIVLGVFLLANAGFFFTYRVQYENRLHDLETKKHETEQRLQAVRAQRAAAEQQIAAYRKAQLELSSIYNERWATEPERLTALISEVKRLENVSQLIGRSHAYSKSEKDNKEGAALGGASLGTSVVTIAFGVQGSYQQVRRLINLLELSPQFVIIDSVGLSGTGGGAPAPGSPGIQSSQSGPLTLTLRLKTIFREQPAPVKPAQQM